MDDEERLRLPVEEDTSQASPIVMKRREMTAGFDERQKQLFNEALIAILTADMPAEKLAQVLTKAYDTTIHVFSWQMLAETRLPSTTCTSPTADRLNPASSERPLLLSCTSCDGHSLTLRGKLVQCDDCCTIQPAIVDQSRIVKNGAVVQELVARYFATGEAAMAALHEENRKPEKDKREARKNNAAEHDCQAELIECGQVPKKEIVNVALNGTTLALMFHDGTVQRQTIPDPAILAISYLLRVLDTMCWAREALENKLLRLSKRRNESH